MKCEPGLRERKKAATHAALSDAAARLTRERGLDMVTVEEIADAANVSIRTFHNYFSSKEEALMAYGQRMAERWAAALVDRPQSEEIWDSIEAILVQAFAGDGEAMAGSLTATDLLDASPTLLASAIGMQEWVQDLVCRAIAQRTGTDADTDLYPRLVNLAAFGVARAAADLWRVGGVGERRLDDLIHDGVAQMRAGLPDPTALPPARPPSLTTQTGQDI